MLRCATVVQKVSGLVATSICNITQGKDHVHQRKPWPSILAVPYPLDPGSSKIGFVYHGCDGMHVVEVGINERSLLRGVG